MKIKRLTHISETFKKQFILFCEKSKPFDFCQSRSRLLRYQKINEYLIDWSKGFEVYEIYKDNKFIFAAVFKKGSESIELEFAFGNFSDFYHNKIADAWHLIIKNIFNFFSYDKITSPIRRKFKRKILLKWLARYDPTCKLQEIDQELIAIWNKNDWHI